MSEDRAKKRHGFMQSVKCPNCGESRMIYRRATSEGRYVQTFCSRRCGSFKALALRPDTFK